MSTLLLRLAGPLQSWGTDSRFEIRRTELYPTKSGVIGLLAAALGRKRDEDIRDLRNLEFGIRVDQPGVLINDFHTARKDEKTSYITNRYYLSDAVFTAGVFSENTELLEELQYAVLHPAFPLFLGRRSCPPSMPIDLGLVNMSLKEALETCPWQGRVPEARRDVKIILEGYGGSVPRRILDDPESFDIRHRKYAPRIVSEYPVPYINVKSGSDQTISFGEHDPMAELED